MLSKIITRMNVLVISNNCFAKNNSNGRILGCLFKNINKSDVSQLYIVPGTNDFELCENYYLLSDRMLLNAIKPKNSIGRIIHEDDIQTNLPKLSEYRSKYGRSSLTMLCREILWMSNLWWNEKLKNWLKETKVDVILFQCGDSPFMYRVVEKIKKYLNIPVVLFNTEYYYFLNDSWLPVNDNKLFFSIYKSILNHNIRKSINNAALSIYNSDWLKEHYTAIFSSRAEVIYQSSDYSQSPKLHNSSIPLISYVGNLGFGRWEPLIEIAEAIHKLNNKWKLDVYGVVQSTEVNKLFENTECLEFHGTVPYDEALDIISRSDLLILVENQKPHFVRSTEYGFSGKITDYLFSGIPILAYGSESNVGISYLKKTKAAMVVTERDKLDEALRKAIFDKAWRSETIATALSIANENHDAYKNAVKFKDYLLELISNNE